MTFSPELPDLKGIHAIVTSGPTREHIDPVRYISNESSGKQGHAIAEAFARAGARVTLITGPVAIPDPVHGNITVVRVISARDMLAAAESALPADIAVCAAAVADFRPSDIVDHKIKKRAGDNTMTITLVENPDILKTLGHHATQRPAIVAGFAAETENVIAYAQGKLEKKRADVIFANSVAGGAVFGQDDTHLTMVTATKNEDWGVLDKQQAAMEIVATLARLLKPKVA